MALNAEYEQFPGTQKYYFAGNVMPGHFDENSQASGRQTTGTPDGYSAWVSSPFFPSYATTESAGDAFKSVLSDVGCTQPALDDHDTRIVNETLNGTYTYSGSISGEPGLPDSEADVGGFEGYPTTSREGNWDTDADGLPDFWEGAVGTNPSSPAGDFSDTNADPEGDGFTRFDQYLDWMAKPHYFASSGGSVSVDLGQQFAGFSSSPAYSVTDAVGGTANVANGTATFTPAGCGFGSMTIGVQDAEGATMSKEVVIFTDGC